MSRRAAFVLVRQLIQSAHFREKIKCKCDFEGYHVDMEYNRQNNFNDPKRRCSKKFIASDSVSCNKKKDGDQKLTSDEKLIIPDLILHKRGESCNILVCEFKILKASKESNVYKEIANDICKLTFMTTQNGKDCNESTACGYKVGIFIGLHKNSKSKNKYILFCNQKELCGSIYSPRGCLTQKAIEFIKCRNG